MPSMLIKQATKSDLVVRNLDSMYWILSSNFNAINVPKFNVNKTSLPLLSFMIDLYRTILMIDNSKFK